MGAKLGFALNSDSIDNHQCQTFELFYAVTGAKAGGYIARVCSPRVLGAYDTGTTQAQIDAFLGTTNEFLATTVFDATSLGLDAYACVIDMAGQVQDVAMVEIVSRLGTTAITASNIKQASAPSAALPVVSQPLIYVGANGNLALKMVLTGLDAATAGNIIIRIHSYLK